MFGFVVINKPTGISSRKALNLLSKHTRPSKVGHAGTLDPLATGVLVACIGPATRLARFVQAMPKSYTGDFRLGVTSDSEDIEGQVQTVENAPPISATDIERVLSNFKGSISQMPPQFSALKVNGKRAYDLARKGKKADLKPREIEIHNISLAKFDYPNFQLNIDCGSGTYVRSIGRDIGLAVNSGAIMTKLIRNSVGIFELASAVDPETTDTDEIAEKIVSPAEALKHLPQIVVTEQQERDFHNGVPIQSSLKDRRAIALAQDGRLLAVMEKLSQAPHLLAPKINFVQYWAKQQSQ